MNFSQSTERSCHKDWSEEGDHSSDCADITVMQGDNSDDANDTDLIDADSAVFLSGRGVRLARMADDDARDASDAAGALQDAGTMIYISSPESPAVECQVFDGDAWGGVPQSMSDQVDNVTASISSTALVPSPHAGMYRVTACVVCTAAGVTDVDVYATWRDENGLQSQRVLHISLNDVTQYVGEYTFHAIPGTGPTPVAFSLTYVGTPGYNGAFNLYVRAERF